MPYKRLCSTKNILTVNGQFPGPTLYVHKGDTIIVDVYNKAKYNITIHWVEQGKTYLLRIINAAMQDLFFSIANHILTVVATDASYTKPLTRDIIKISPGQTIDVLLKANQNADHYYMAARVYSSALGVACDNTTATTVVEYSGKYALTSPTPLPQLPYHNDTSASVNFTGSLRSLASDEHPIDVPKNITNHFIFTISVNSFPCPNNSCAGPNGTRLAASVNNISFTNPSIDILQAYYYDINGVSEPSSLASHHTSSMSRPMTCCWT
ncbi:hypothetical protein EUGRSUZ_J03171 [Eucalyptus grandis]|uniref:Uncharacterized protein n=2 Tax=Eucalyptus grandis TaxID=71139 RepID=A0ACC3JBX6_EUCGR|nr:hypothetical protein EUGRSUZ_J03171 [Eucalyptus grandis]